MTKLLWLKTELSLEKLAAACAIELVTFLLNPTVVSDNTTSGNYKPSGSYVFNWGLSLGTSTYLYLFCDTVLDYSSVAKYSRAS